MDLLVVCVFAYFLMRHPEVIGEAIAEVGHALAGEESPAAARRRQRLQDAGIDPASGGAARQFAGNVWRDFWLDQDRARAKRRAQQTATADADRKPRSWWDRLVDRLYDAWCDRVDRHATENRRPEEPADPDRHDDSDWNWPDDWPDSDPPDQPGPDGNETPRPATDDNNPGDSNTDSRPGPTDPPDRHDNQERPGRPYNERSEQPSQPGPAEPPPTARPQPGYDQDREPIRVKATVGEPVTEPRPEQPQPELPAPPADQEGTPTMSSTVATRGIQVTGVVSGAAECLSIYQAVEQAIAEFQNRLEAIAARTHTMGESTLGIVQFAGASGVVVRMAQAAEAIAATKAQARAMGSEVGPLLLQTRQEFQRRNS